MSEKVTSLNKASEAVSRARRNRYDGFMDMLLRRWGGSQSAIPGDNKLYSNMSRFWHHTLASAGAEELYVSNGLASIIIDRPADDCFIHGFKVDGDDDDLMSDELDRLSVSSTYSDALRWARLFGASAILMMVKDGGTWADPLNLDTIDIVEDLIVFDLRYIRPTDKLYDDETDPKFGKPEWFLISPPGGTEFEVHETRLITFSGDPMPKSMSNRSQVWWLGKSVLSGCMTELERLSRALYWAEKLLERKQQGIWKMNELGTLIQNDMEDQVNKRIDRVDYARNNLNSIVIDGEDDYDVKNLGLDNLNNVIGEFQIAVCAASGFPSVILFGKSSTSLNTTGAGELESYYGMCGRIQQRVLSPALEYLISVLWNQRSLRGSIPDEWEVEWEPLWQPTEKEQAEVKNIKATAKNTEVDMLLKLMDASILMPEEVRKIIVNEYGDYGFADSPDTSGGDQQYARSVGGDDGPGGNADGP